MPSPVFTLAFIIATLFGAGFHLVVGGRARRLSLFLLASWVGFAVGQSIGISFEIDILRIGELRILPALIAMLIALFIMHIVTNERAVSHRRAS